MVLLIKAVHDTYNLREQTSSQTQLTNNNKTPSLQQCQMLTRRGLRDRCKLSAHQFRGVFFDQAEFKERQLVFFL